jgi:hypothetical protein
MKAEKPHFLFSICYRKADYQTKSFIVEDSKGFRTQVYKMKKKAILEIYGIKIKET